MSSPQISAIIIAKNEAEMIGACLDTLTWCSEVVLLNDGSEDETAEIAENKGAKVVAFKHHSFARLRQEALKHAQHDWVVYIDADERVTPSLAQEILVHAETNTHQVLQIKRKNILYGIEMQHGGWGIDILPRVFNKSALQGWEGNIHESPVFTGEAKTLNNHLVHLTHRDTVSGLLKTAAWTPMEAEGLAAALTTPVTFKTIVRKGIGEFVRRAIKKKAYKDGQAGLVEALIQAINRMLIYIQVWERQQNPPLAEKYALIEKSIQDSWKVKESHGADTNY